MPAEGRLTTPMPPNSNLDHNFRQSLVAGVKSLTGGKGRTYYVLTHMTHSGNFRAGQEQEIIIDYIELGRDPKCQVRFDEAQKTVSRKHAAIVREGNNWVLRNLSQKNPTLINGRPVNVQWFLNSGDEIQLSVEGPRIRFVIPHNNSVASIPLSRRLSLFRQQALRPYKTAIAVLSVLFVLGMSGMGFWLFKTQKHAEQLEFNIKNAVAEGQKIKTEMADSLKLVKQQGEQSEKRVAALRKEIKNVKGLLRRSMEAQQQQAPPPPNVGSAPALPSSAPASSMSDLEKLYGSVYFVRLERLTVTMDGESEDIRDLPISGTGFLLADGRFVTARHMVEPWYFFDSGNPDAAMVVLNMLTNNGGNVVAHLKAYSPNGSTLSFSSAEFKMDRSSDETISIVEPESGANVFVKIAKLDGGTDWATYSTGKTGLIGHDNSLSENLPMGSTLYFLGYPFGLGANDPSNIKPLMGHCEVSTGGLSNGSIVVSNRNYEPGNSGGPVMYYANGQYIAVGIVSVGIGSSSGMVVPIRNAR